MAKNKFEAKYPGYAIIPEKKNRLKWPAIYLATFIGLVVVPLLALKGLSYSVPTPVVAGVNTMTKPTIKEMALMQSERNEHAEAAQNFERYFILGGDEADMMAMYAFSLKELGRMAEARVWSKKSLQKDPESRAAKIMRDTLKN